MGRWMRQLGTGRMLGIIIWVGRRAFSSSEMNE
jgi:hypothetical protein